MNRFYRARYHTGLRSIFAMGDMCSYIPDSDADVVSTMNANKIYIEFHTSHPHIDKSLYNDTKNENTNHSINITNHIHSAF